MARTWALSTCLQFPGRFGSAGPGAIASGSRHRAAAAAPCWRGAPRKLRPWRSCVHATVVLRAEGPLRGGGPPLSTLLSELALRRHIFKSWLCSRLLRAAPLTNLAERPACKLAEMVGMHKCMLHTGNLNPY